MMCHSPLELGDLVVVVQPVVGAQLVRGEPARLLRLEQRYSESPVCRQKSWSEVACRTVCFNSLQDCDDGDPEDRGADEDADEGLAPRRPVALVLLAVQRVPCLHRLPSAWR